MVSRPGTESRNLLLEPDTVCISVPLLGETRREWILATRLPANEGSAYRPASALNRLSRFDRRRRLWDLWSGTTARDRQCPGSVRTPTERTGWHDEQNWCCT